MENVETEPLVREDQLCKELLLEAMKYHLLPEQRSSLVSQRTLERKPEGMKVIIYINSICETKREKIRFRWSRSHHSNQC